MSTGTLRADIIVAARNAIGDGQPDDWVIAPSRHATELAEPAPALAEVLRRSGPETAAREFERLDADAIRAQQVFKRTAGRANLAVLITACLSAGMLIVSSLEALEEVRRVGLGVLGVLSVLGGGLTAMWLFRLKQGDLFDHWNRCRAGAEMRRLDYFRRVVEAEPGVASDIPFPLLALEYFRRYQLDVQLAFYGSRSRSHRAAADRTLRLEAIAVLLATVGAGLGGVLAFAADRPEFASLAAIGVFGAALAAYAAAAEAISQDRRNAERYERTLTSLLALREQLDPVRAAAAAGDREPALRLVDAVHEQLSLEHREWLDSGDATRSSVALLEASLRPVTAPEPRSTTTP